MNTKYHQLLKRLVFPALLFFAVFAACTKQTNTYFHNGSAPVLKSSVMTVAAKPADSLKNALVLSWTNPKYATDSSTIKYILQIDSSGRNFSRAVSISVTGALSDSLSAKQINTIALGFGFAYNVAYKMDVRLISSYANNNEQYTSNTIILTVTPYVIPPKIAPPSSGALFLVGDASQGGWNNPVPVPTQQFEKIDSVTYGGVFNLNGGKQYLMLPVNGDWSNKYSVADNTVPGLSSGGSFGYNLSSNFPGPSAAGWYKIIVSFQQGTFTVTPYTQVLPDSLFMVGDATPGGWSNPVPDPSQAFTRLNSSQFTLTLSLTGGKQYLMLPVNGSWSAKFAVADNSISGLSAGGNFGYYTSGGANFPAPANNGTYKITADFLNYTFWVTQ
jgi:hypothetical protein